MREWVGVYVCIDFNFHTCNIFQSQTLTKLASSTVRKKRNQISSIWTYLQCIVGNVSEVSGSARTIIAQFGGEVIFGNFTLNAPRIRLSDYVYNKTYKQYTAL